MTLPAHQGRGPVHALRLACAMIALGAIGPIARGQAGADHCVDAPAIMADHQYNGNNIAATIDIFQTPCSDADSYDVFYKFTATRAGDHAIDTLFSALDTTLAVYATCGGTMLACNDDVDPDNFDYTSLVILPLSVGQTIYIRVAGYGQDTGTFGLYVGAPPVVTTMGACCRGSACAVEGSDVCTGADVRYVGADTTCNALANFATPCCKADFNQNGTVEVQDIFDYLNAWFTSDPRCDINVSGGVEIQDIFDFLNAWFAGC